MAFAGFVPKQLGSCTKRTKLRESSTTPRKFNRSGTRIGFVLSQRRRKPTNCLARNGLTMGLTVRAAGEDDISAVDSLLSRSYPVLLKDDYSDALLQKVLPLIAQAQPALVTCGTYYVAEIDGSCVGAGGWTLQVPGEKHSEPGRANVRHLVTDALHLRKGIGRALMAHVLKETKAAGATWIHCMSTRTAEPFYAAVGFKTIGQIEVLLAPNLGFPAIEMRLDL